MNNAQILRLLMPVRLGGDANGLLAAQGAALDEAEGAAADFLNEILPDFAHKTIADWERVFNITPSSGATLADRREKLVCKKRDTGGLSRQYFIDLAAALGQTITIEEFAPTRCGVTECGDEVSGDEAIMWVWEGSGLTDSGVYARCGEFCCGEALGGDNLSVEAIFEELKPAHTQVYFSYTEVS